MRSLLAFTAIGAAVAVAVACSDSNDTAASATPGTSTAPFAVKIIGFNDYHGNLESPGTFGATAAVPAAERPADGGADFIAAHVAKLKSQNANSVVVGAGDFIGASPLISASFHDEAQTVNALIPDLRAQGVESIVVLVHEGGFQTGTLGDINGCEGNLAGSA